LLIPPSPIACTRSSTRRVETPPIQASCNRRLLGYFARLQERREITPLAQFWDAQLQFTKPCVEAAVAEAIAPRDALAAAFVTAGADQAVHIGLHQQLQDRLRHAAQEIAIAGLFSRSSLSANLSSAIASSLGLG
jgi:hypothetical protein